MKERVRGSVKGAGGRLCEQGGEGESENVRTESVMKWGDGE